MIVHPLKRLLDPFEFARSLVIKDSQPNKVSARRNTLILRIGAPDDSGDMRPMKTCWPIVERICIILGKVPSANHSKIFTQPTSKGIVIPGNPTVDHCNGLPCSSKRIATANVLHVRRYTGRRDRRRCKLLGRNRIHKVNQFWKIGIINDRLGS